MNEIQIYSAVMFFAGVALSHAVFYFDRINKKKNFYIFLSAVALQILDNANLLHQANAEFSASQLKTTDDLDKQEYLEKEAQKISVFMEVYVLLLIKAIPKEGRKHIKFRTWPEARSLLEKMRGLIQNEQSEG